MKQDNLSRYFELIRDIDRVLSRKRNIKACGVDGCLRNYLISHILKERERVSVIICPDEKKCKSVYLDCTFFLSEQKEGIQYPERRVFRFPQYDISPFRGLSPRRDIVKERLESLFMLSSGGNSVIITSLEALIFKILPKDEFLKSVDILEPQEELDLDSLRERLFTLGYRPVSMVEERGDYALRGYVLDIFPPLYSLPIRIEFWGERIESIRQFNPFNQRSVRSLDEIILIPFSEVIWRKENIQRARERGRLPETVTQVAGFPGQEAWINHFYRELNTLFDYLPEESLIILLDGENIEEKAIRMIEKAESEIERYALEAEKREQYFPDTEGIILDMAYLREEIGKFKKIQFVELPFEKRGDEDEVLELFLEDYSYDRLILELESKKRLSLAPLIGQIRYWIKAGSRVVVVCSSDSQIERTREIFENYGVRVWDIKECWGDIPFKRGLYLCRGDVSGSLYLPQIELFLIDEDSIYGKRRIFKRGSIFRERLRERFDTSSELREGDFVVHQEHGIGRYKGLHRLEVDGIINDYVLIEYANDDRLYIPSDRISVLQKYIGPDEREPSLDQLGGRAWSNSKERVKRSVKKIARQLVELYALREMQNGFAFSPPDNRLREFEATFPYEETPDQIKAIEDVLKDMQSERPMDRLICGDVGFGKTEVALRASFKAVMDGKQVAVLVPTTVLAEQHWRTFKERMEPYRIRVEVLSRFRSRVEQKRIVAELRSKKIDIIIGTHRLLQKDVEFADLGLLIIDEEHRFGVKQKEKIKRYRTRVDVLSLSATPIPRTLQMSLIGIRDMSLIMSPPENRYAIQTHIIPFDEEKIRYAIEMELERAGQVFFVHNNIRDIHEIGDMVKELVPDANVAIAHGQMKEKELEETMIQFIRNEIDVLICTTIIESGLDIPSVNTIIIDEAERLGLSQIYQLRGRVGRSDKTAYAYLVIRDGAALTREAEKRLRALMEFSRLGSGINLALHDLKIRGGGNILGFNQSGHIYSVGYELYLKYIRKAIAELKGREWIEDIDPEISIKIQAYLPSEYVPDMDLRLSLYRRLSSVEDHEELNRLKEEIIDRFGRSPIEALNLFDIIYLRVGLKRLRVLKMNMDLKGVMLRFSKDTILSPKRLIESFKLMGLNMRFLGDDTLFIYKDSRDIKETLGYGKELIDQLLSLI